MVGGLENGQFSQTADQSHNSAGWSPNYADIANSVVQRQQYVRASYAPTHAAADYLQEVILDPNYASYAFANPAAQPLP
ncbi:MAG: hypothetical protein ACRD3W_23095, partial [Terriglobales bacterium]